MSANGERPDFAVPPTADIRAAIAADLAAHGRRLRLIDRDTVATWESPGPTTLRRVVVPGARVFREEIILTQHPDGTLRAGRTHTMSRSDVARLIGMLQAWLDTGSLSEPLPATKPEE